MTIPRRRWRLVSLGGSRHSPGVKKRVFVLLVVALLAGGVYVASNMRERQPAWIVADREALGRAAIASNESLSRAVRTTSRGGTTASAAALAQAIRFSKRQTLAAGTHTIPSAIREALEQFFPEDVLDDVRWTTAGNRIDLDSALAGWYLHEGAVTLDNAIVFSNRGTAEHLGLWAHELTHVVQYRELGIDAFARLYTTHWRLLEQQAGRNAGRVVASIGKRKADQLGALDQAQLSRRTGMHADLPVDRAIATSCSSSPLAPRGHDKR